MNYIGSHHKKVLVSSNLRSAESRLPGRGNLPRGLDKIEDGEPLVEVEAIQNDR